MLKLSANQKKAIAIKRLRKQAKYHGKKKVDAMINGVKPKSNINPRKGSRFVTDEQAIRHHWKQERLARIKLAKLEGIKIRDDF